MQVLKMERLRAQQKKKGKTNSNRGTFSGIDPKEPQQKHLK